jgi:histidinol-phosphate aminotransferase
VAGTSIEAVRAAHGLDEITKLASNESPIGPSPKAMAAIQAALSSVHRYPPTAPSALHAALAQHHGCGLTADHFAVGNGASELIDMLTRGFIAPGDNVVVCRPTFPLYDISARRWGAELVWADMNHGFGFDVGCILSLINRRTRIIHICTPNNPSGTIMTPQQAEQLVQHVPDNILIVFDESYWHFVERSESLIDTISYITCRTNVVSVHSFSKTYGLAGLRVGYAIAAPPIAKYLERMHQPFFCGSLALTAAIAALDDHEYVQQVRDLVLLERDWLTDRLEALDLEVIPSQANFVTARAPYPPELIYERMVAQGVIIRPLAMFYLPGWFRITVGRREDNVRCIDVLRSVLEQLAEEYALPAS